MDEPLKAQLRDELVEAAQRIFSQARTVEALAREFLKKFRMLYKVIFSFKGKVSKQRRVKK